jgi:serine/threonine protein kinase
MAPEMIDDSTSYGFEVDVWAIGVIMYILLFGESPFDALEKNDLYAKIKEGKFGFPKGIITSDSAKDLLRKVLQKDPCKKNLLLFLVHEF